jgi:hypothetical protein
MHDRSYGLGLADVDGLGRGSLRSSRLCCCVVKTSTTQTDPLNVPKPRCSPVVSPGRWIV